MGPLAMLVLLVAALSLFTATVIRRLDVLRSAQPDNRLDQPGRRFKALLGIGFGQRKLRYETGPGWMHVVIFAGFLVVAFRTLTMIIRGFDAGWRIAGLNEGYLVLHNLLEVAVIVATPLSAPLTLAIVSWSPSGSLSLARTSTSTELSSSVVAESLLGVGARLVTSSSELPPQAARVTVRVRRAE